MIKENELEEMFKNNPLFINYLDTDQGKKDIEEAAKIMSDAIDADMLDRLLADL